jgi:hypothetical protein
MLVSFVYGYLVGTIVEEGIHRCIHDYKQPSMKSFCFHMLDNVIICVCKICLLSITIYSIVDITKHTQTQFV